jgi:putative transposase
LLQDGGDLLDGKALSLHGTLSWPDGPDYAAALALNVARKPRSPSALGKRGAMKKTRFSEEQMVTILREADEKPVPEVAKKHEISAQTIYGWRKHFGSLEPADVKRLRHLEQENGRLKRLVADRDLELEVLKEITRKKW